MKPSLTKNDADPGSLGSVEMAEVQTCKVILNTYAPLDISPTRALSFLSLFKPRAQYIGGGHANRAPLLLKSHPTLTLQLWDRSPTWDSQVFTVPAQNRTQTTHHGVWAQLGFLCCNLNK